MTQSCTAHYFETRKLFTYSLVERTSLVKKDVTEVHEIFRLYFPVTQKYGKFIEDTILEKQERIVESFALRKISIDELIEIRKQNISGFVLKENNTYYFTRIPKNLRFIYIENLAQIYSLSFFFYYQKCRKVTKASKSFVNLIKKTYLCISI